MMIPLYGYHQHHRCLPGALLTKVPATALQQWLDGKMLSCQKGWASAAVASGSTACQYMCLYIYIYIYLNIYTRTIFADCSSGWEIDSPHTQERWYMIQVLSWNWNLAWRVDWFWYCGCWHGRTWFRICFVALVSARLTSGRFIRGGSGSQTIVL